MVWSHNDQWMVTGDTGGFVKYWQTNMNNVKLFQAHKDPVRGLRYPHLCHRPFSTFIVTAIITPTTTHSHHPCLMIRVTPHGYQRFSICRRSCFSWVISVSHLLWNRHADQSFLSWTCFPVFKMSQKRISSVFLTVYFNRKPKQFISILETLYYILILTHLQRIKVLLSILIYIFSLIHFHCFQSQYHYYIIFSFLQLFNFPVSFNFYKYCLIMNKSSHCTVLGVEL